MKRLPGHIRQEYQPKPTVMQLPKTQHIHASTDLQHHIKCHLVYLVLPQEESGLVELSLIISNAKYVFQTYNHSKCLRLEE